RHGAARRELTRRHDPPPVHRMADRVGCPGCRAGDYLISQSTVPWVTAAPASTARSVTTPSLCAATGFSIFMASRTAIWSPALTSWPSSTATLTTVPCIGEDTASPEASAPAAPSRVRALALRRTVPPLWDPPKARSPGRETSTRRPSTSTTTFL